MTETTETKEGEGDREQEGKKAAGAEEEQEDQKDPLEELLRERGLGRGEAREVLESALGEPEGGGPEPEPEPEEPAEPEPEGDLEDRLDQLVDRKVREALKVRRGEQPEPEQKEEKDIEEPPTEGRNLYEVDV